MLFQILGPLEAQAPGGRSLTIKPGKPTMVLTTLLLHHNRWVSVDKLIDATWHDRAMPASAAGNLKSYICGLRRSLPPAGNGTRIESRPGAYRIVVGQGEIDVDHFEQNAADARRALVDEDLERVAKLLTDALDLWRGRPFDGLTTPAAIAEVARLDRVRTEMRQSLAEVCHAIGRHADAITLLHELLDEDPLREHAWARLVLVFNETGQRNEALATYRRARSVIVRELGVEPGAFLAGAHHTVLRGCA